MGFRIDNSEGIWTGDYGSHLENLRERQPGEVVVECEWDSDLNRPFGVTMPTTPAQPDWPAFRLGVLASPSLVRITSAVPSILVANLTEIAWRLDAEPHRLSDFATIWNTIAVIASPTEAEILELNTVAASANVPFVLNQDGLLG